MWRYVIGMAFMSLVSIKGIETYMDVREDLHSGSSQQNAGYSNSALQNDVAQEEDTYSYNGRKTRIKMDNRGHFVTTAKMNGRRVEVLVDTGATSVAPMPAVSGLLVVWAAIQALADTAAVSKTSETFSLKLSISDDWNFSSLNTSVTTIFDATSPAA